MKKKCAPWEFSYNRIYSVRIKKVQTDTLWQKTIVIFFLSFFGNAFYAQSVTENFIESIVYKVPTYSAIPDPEKHQANRNITYLNGLGAPVQERAIHQSTSGKDIVRPVEYDSYGRQVKNYLPYATASSSPDFNADAPTELAAFYSYPAVSSTGNPKFESTNYPYTEILYDNSPLQNILHEAAEGNDWHLTSGHILRKAYLSNSNEVKMYKATSVWNPQYQVFDPTLSYNGQYSQGELYLTITRNQNFVSGDVFRNSVHVYKDKSGKIILKKQFEGNNQLETYYVYDQYGNLSFVIPPLSADPAAELDALCYQYRYDSKNRMVEKKIPGRSWEFIVYDNTNRVVASGPRNSPFKENNDKGWLFAKYDIFGRIAYSGWYNGHTSSRESRVSIQNIQNLQSVIYESPSAFNVIDNVTIAYSNVTFPTNSFYLLNVNYYDNYNFPNAAYIPTQVENEDVLANLKNIQTGGFTRTLTTASESLGSTSTKLYDKKGRIISTYARNYLDGYDKIDLKIDFEGKPEYFIYLHKRNSSSAEIKIRENFSYSSGSNLLTHTQQINDGQIQILESNFYDELGTLIRKDIGGDLNGALQKVDFSYNVRGWLKEINDINNLTDETNDLFAFKINYNEITGSIANSERLFNGNISETFWKTDSDNNLRKYSYRYDDLDRLKEAIYQKPDDNVKITNSYDEYINYDINGNIIGLIRNGGLDSQSSLMEIDDLEYFYEPKTNRLLKILDHSRQELGFRDDGNGISDDEDDFDYDLFGNLVKDQNKHIQSIKYNHLDLPVEIAFDNNVKICYFYDSNGVKLKKKIFYINCPPNIVCHVDSFEVDYLGPFIYKQGNLQFILTEGGYIQNVAGSDPTTIGSPMYVFHYKDHLGNIRLSFGQDPQNTTQVRILEENHYYPYGLKHSNYNSDYLRFERINEGILIKDPVRPPTSLGRSPLFYNYKYNGKELQDDLGLNLYDYGARNYDPSTGKWMNIDPLAEMDRSFSPYVFARDNPVYFVDPDGMLSNEFMFPDGWIVNDFTGQVTFDPDIGPNNTPWGSTYLCEQCHLSDFLLTGFAPSEYLKGDFLQDDGSRNQRIYMDEVFIGDASAVNMETVGQNLLNSTYGGPDNPKSYDGNDTFRYVPTRLDDFPPIGHDRGYGNLGISGASGLFMDRRAIGQDYKFVAQEFAIATGPFDPLTKLRASILGGGLGLFALPKTIAHFANPNSGGLGYVMMWYNISNAGVTNIPDK